MTTTATEDPPPLTSAVPSAPITILTNHHHNSQSATSSSNSPARSPLPPSPAPAMPSLAPSPASEPAEPTPPGPLQASRPQSPSVVLAAAFYDFPPSPPPKFRLLQCTAALGYLVFPLPENLALPPFVPHLEQCSAPTARVPHVHDLGMCSYHSFVSYLSLSPRKAPAVC